MHPDSTILVVQTLNGYLLTYSVASDPSTRVYQQRFDHSTHPRRRESDDVTRFSPLPDRFPSPDWFRPFCSQDLDTNHRLAPNYGTFDWPTVAELTLGIGLPVLKL